MKLSLKAVIMPAIILGTICLSVSGLLALTNELTKDVIAEAQALKEEQSRMIVLPNAESFKASEDESYHIAYSGEEIVGYVFLTESKGYGGTVMVMTGIDVNSQITGVTLVSQNETPGLGTNATKEVYTDQYKQEANTLTVVKSVAGEGEIQALTGATITSDAVTDAVNIAIDIYNSVKGES